MERADLVIIDSIVYEGQLCELASERALWKNCFSVFLQVPDETSDRAVERADDRGAGAQRPGAHVRLAEPVQGGRMRLQRRRRLSVQYGGTWREVRVFFFALIAEVGT